MDLLKKGKRIVIAIIVVLILIDILSSSGLASIYIRLGDTHTAIIKIFHGLISLFLESLILYFLYKGHQWAKILITVVLLIRGVSSFSSFLYVITTLEAIYVTLLGLIYIGIISILFLSKSVNGFLLHQGNKANTSEKTKTSEKHEQSDSEDSEN